MAIREPAVIRRTPEVSQSDSLLQKVDYVSIAETFSSLQNTDSSALNGGGDQPPTFASTMEQNAAASALPSSQNPDLDETHEDPTFYEEIKLGKGGEGFKRLK